MKNPLRNSALLLFLTVILLFPACRALSADQESNEYPVMRPDYETRMKWIESYENAPRIKSVQLVESAEFSPGGSIDLLSHLDYTPSQRNQGSCGNCWAWAGTGVMEIALDVQEGIHERLSIQYLNSCDDTGYACCGGWLADVEDFYSEKGRAIPWSNTNASWQDGGSSCSAGESAVPCEDISLSPMFSIQSIETQTIETHGVGQAEAIANIKGVLDQNRAVWFAFFMGTADDWSAFYSFWSNQGEDTLWDFDTTCGHTYTSGGGGHAVLCVGYNDDVAEPYWIMLNSWGASSNRPNGLFRVAMDMDYDCTYTQGLNSYYSIYWQTLDIEYSTVATEEATSVTSSSATLNGNISLDSEYTAYYFEYGTTTDYGPETESADIESGTGYAAVSADIADLAVYTTYHYRIVATGSGDPVYGNDETFTTLAVVPTVITGLVSSAGLNSATLEGTVNPHHAETTYYFQYGTTTAYGSETASMSVGSGTDNVPVEAGISDLSPCTEYHYRIVATNTAGTAEGANSIFSTACAEEGGGGGGGCFISVPGL